MVILVPNPCFSQYHYKLNNCCHSQFTCAHTESNFERRIINWLCPNHSGWCLSSAVERFHQVQSGGERKAIYVRQRAGLHLGDRMWWEPRATACILNNSLSCSALHSTWASDTTASSSWGGMVVERQYVRSTYVSQVSKVAIDAYIYVQCAYSFIYFL